MGWKMSGITQEVHLPQILSTANPGGQIQRCLLYFNNTTCKYIIDRPCQSWEANGDGACTTKWLLAWASGQAFESRCGIFIWTLYRPSSRSKIFFRLIAHSQHNTGFRPNSANFCFSAQCWGQWETSSQILSGLNSGCQGDYRLL